MMSNFVFIIIFYFGVELIYFYIADKYNIIDKPNHRSSHITLTIRGGGIIFPLAFLIPLVVTQYTGWIYVSMGIIAISTISLLDDMITLNNKLRLIIQSFSVALLLWQVIPVFPVMALFLLFIMVTGIINAYNFMDGINGISALYSLVTLGTLYWINHTFVLLLPDLFFVSLLASLLVFSFFNLRKQARCFAGDVGSVSIAFIICFLLLSLFVKTGFAGWILLLAVYGLDTVFTIICRILRKEPIFKAHRSHFYQYLANEAGMGHVSVSILYAGIQFLCNICVILAYQKGEPLIAISSLFVLLLIYIIFRLRLEGSHRLFKAY